MRWIEFMYDKDGEFTRRMGLEFGPALRGEGNVAVYQKEPEPGFRTFKAAKMHDVNEVVSPWLAEVYAQRLARLRAPLFAIHEQIWLVGLVVYACMVVGLIGLIS